MHSVRATVLTILIWGCLLLPTPGWPASKEDLRQLRSRIEALQKELAGSKESKSEAADSLRESERAISDANRKLAELAGQQREANAALNQLQTQSRQLDSEIQSQQALLGKLLYQQYLNGQQEYLRLLLNHQDPNQVARNLHYFGYISRARAEWLKTLRSNLAELEQLTRQTKEKSAELAVIQAEQAEQKKRLEKEKAERQKVLARISKKIDKQRREISKLKRDENRLTRLVEKLGKMLSRKNSAVPLNNTRVPDASVDASPFAQLKGKLSLPVRGELANRFGSPRSDGGVLWKGLFIRSASGREVKAVAAGRVVFADWLRGFGNLLIVDHGLGYMSLYGNNETLYKQVGDAIHGGDTIAAVGNSGGNPESGLYFELRYQGKPFDPLTWVTLK